MSVPSLVADFYARLWNAGDDSALPELLSPEFSFRGSLGDELHGPAAFWGYVCGIRSALAHYRCEILECVAEGGRAFAKMRFSGIHVGPFRGHSPSGRPVQWEGAALFRFEAGRIRELWVLGDLVGLDAALKSNARPMSLALTRAVLDGQPLGIFGAGHLGRAIAEGLLRLGLPRNQIVLCHGGTPSTREALSAAGLDDLVVEAGQVVSRSKIVLYLVRPQDCGAIARHRVRADALFVSFLAGIALARIPVDVADPHRVRVMTSAPDTLRRRLGLAAVHASDADAARPVREILECLGLRIVALSKESELHAFTALGPCLPVALDFWRSRGNRVDEVELYETARRHALPDGEAIVRWALCTATAGHAVDWRAEQAAAAATPGGITDAILGAIRQGMRLSQALDCGIERSRELDRLACCAISH